MFILFNFSLINMWKCIVFVIVHFAYFEKSVPRHENLFIFFSSFGIQRIINLLCKKSLFSIHHHVNSCVVFECSPCNCQLAIIIHQSSPSPLFIFTMWPLDFHLGSLLFDMFTITKSESISQTQIIEGP